VGAADSAEPVALTSAERAAIGRAFAPILVFHPLEDYFPTSPMFPFDSNELPELRGVPDVRSRMGSQITRVGQYRQLSTAEKLHHAALQYRVFSRTVRGHVEIVAEYWCYYVFNAFTVHGAWLPYRVPDNHPHDLERIYFVLRLSSESLSAVDAPNEQWARSAFYIERVIANAHDGNVPPNEYHARRGEQLLPPLSVLVERGSHAMAPDINRDGRFTPGIDSTASRKLLWGIRDGGATWGRYRQSYMIGRGDSSVRLCPGTDDLSESEPRCQPYALYPAADLQRWFRGIQFTHTDLSELVGRTPWMVRAFGDVRIERLMIPPDPPDGRVLDAMLRRRAKTETGFVAGLTTTGAHVPTFIAGRRYFWAVQSRYAPDIMAEASVLLPMGTGGHRKAEATILGSYAVDAITNVVVGSGWFSDGRSGQDVLAGLDLRIGRFRVRPTWRFREATFDSRITMTF
jgi:hypothetical protein